jgi:S-DNA-T family DNA segregation ATPase FtsK/SpoIIIE
MEVSAMVEPTVRRLEDELVQMVFLVAFGIILAAGFGLWWGVRHPRSTLLAGGLTAACVLLGPGGLVTVGLGLAVVAVLWRWAHRASFDCFVLGPWRRAWVYAWRWRKAMTMADLGDVYLGVAGPDGWGTSRYVPKLKRVRSDRWCDRVSVRLLAGQHPGMFEDRSDHLAHTFGAQACRVQWTKPGRVVLAFQRRDALAEIVPALPIRKEPDLRDLPVGVLEDGTPWTVPLAGSHLLVGGSTGAGKGSVIWSLIRAAAPCVHDGTVQFWCVDPKGGMELSAGEAMFTRFAYDDPAEMADLFDEAADLLRKRATRLRGVTRKHTPTRIEPLVVVVVDEMAFLTAYLPDRDLRRRIGQSLSILLSQGRAVGVVVVAALQDPRKEVLPFRDLFPIRVALRLTEPEQSRIMLGPGAHDRGAECERIPVSLPGVGYVVLDGLPNPVRVRAAWVTDDDIAAMAQRYPARRGDVIDTDLADGHTPPTDANVIDLMRATTSSETVA